MQTEALAMLLRYKIIDKRFVQLLLGLLEEPIEETWLPRGLSARSRRLSSVAR